MSPEIGLGFEYITPNCYILQTPCYIRSCNRVYHSSIPTDFEIETVKSLFGKKPFTWAVNNNHEEACSILEKHNLHSIGSFSAMSLHLSNLKLTHYNSNILVQNINYNNELIDTWINVVAKSFNVPDKELMAMLTFLSKKITPGSLELYLAYHQGKPVSTCMVIKHNNTIATLHWIATLPEFRNKGFGLAITHQVILATHAQGIQQLTLLSSAMGKSVYEKLGFTEDEIYKLYTI